RLPEELTFSFSIHYSSDGKKIFAGVSKANTPVFDGGLQIWDVDEKKLLSKHMGGGHIQTAAGGRLLLHSDDGGATLRIFDAAKNELLPIKMPGPQVRQPWQFFSTSPDSSTLLRVDRDVGKAPVKSTIRKFDLKTGELLAVWSDLQFVNAP